MSACICPPNYGVSNCPYHSAVVRRVLDRINAMPPVGPREGWFGKEST